MGVSLGGSKRFFFLRFKSRDDFSLISIMFRRGLISFIGGVDYGWGI